MLGQLVRLSKHSAIYGLGAIASQAVNFLLIPVYTRYLAPADYGALEIFHTTLAILGIIATLGLWQGLFRHFFEYDTEEKRRTAISTAFFFSLAFGAIFCLTLVLYADSIARLLFGSEAYALYFRISFATLFLDSLAMVSLSVIRAKQQSKKYVGVTLGRFLASVVFKLFFLIVLGRSVLGILEAELIAVSLVVIALIPEIVRSVAFRFSASALRSMLSFGLPLVPSSLAYWVMTMSDRYFLQFFSTSEELGLYSMGAKLGMVMQVVIVAPLQLAWSQLIFLIAKEDNAKEVYSRSLTYYLLLGSFATLGLAVLSREILMVMTTPAFYSAQRVVPIIATVNLVVGCRSLVGVGILLKKKTQYLAFAMVGAAIVNMGLLYLMVPSYGMVGAALAGLIGQLILAASVEFTASRLYPIRYEWSRLSKIIVVGAAVYAGSLLVATDSVVLAGLVKMVLVLSYPFLLLTVGFWKPEEIERARQAASTCLAHLKHGISQIESARG
ncbi:MAG: polysaccharide biosynthesis protein [Chloroflexi bacterium]|nr:polysaccharide biosynthesis protein [Chloroflexota bacterium]